MFPHVPEMARHFHHDYDNNYDNLDNYHDKSGLRNVLVTGTVG